MCVRCVGIGSPGSLLTEHWVFGLSVSSCVHCVCVGCVGIGSPGSLLTEHWVFGLSGSSCVRCVCVCVLRLTIFFIFFQNTPFLKSAREWVDNNSLSTGETASTHSQTCKYPDQLFLLENGSVADRKKRKHLKMEYRKVIKK